MHHSETHKKNVPEFFFFENLRQRRCLFHVRSTQVRPWGAHRSITAVKEHHKYEKKKVPSWNNTQCMCIGAITVWLDYSTVISQRMKVFEVKTRKKRKTAFIGLSFSNGPIHLTMHFRFKPDGILTCTRKNRTARMLIFSFFFHELNLLFFCEFRLPCPSSSRVIIKIWRT